MKTLEELGFELESDYHYLVYKSKDRDMVEFSGDKENTRTPVTVQIGIEIYFDGSEVYVYEEVWYPIKKEFKRNPVTLSDEVIIAIANRMKELKEANTYE